jgi:hypothetical protein
MNFEDIDKTSRMKCPKVERHEWKAVEADEACPYCRLSEGPRRWTPKSNKGSQQDYDTDNGVMDASEAARFLENFSISKIRWQCDKCEGHRWWTSITNLAWYNRPCPFCSPVKKEH